MWFLGNYWKVLGRSRVVLHFPPLPRVVQSRDQKRIPVNYLEMGRSGLAAVLGWVSNNGTWGVGIPCDYLLQPLLGYCGQCELMTSFSRNSMLPNWDAEGVCISSCPCTSPHCCWPSNGCGWDHAIYIKWISDIMAKWKTLGAHHCPAITHPRWWSWVAAEVK